MSKVVPQGPPPELAERINAEHAAAEAALRSGLEHARNAGELLNEAKGRCAHGAWLPWLKANVRFSSRTAQAYMRIAREWDRLGAKCATVAHLGCREALELLAGPEPTPVPAKDDGATPWLQKMRQGLAALQAVLDDPEASVTTLAQVQELAGEYLSDAVERKLRAERALGTVLHEAEAEAGDERKRDAPPPKRFFLIEELHAMRVWMERRRESWPAEETGAFTAAVRRIVDNMDATEEARRRLAE